MTVRLRVSLNNKHVRPSHKIKIRNLDREIEIIIFKEYVALLRYVNN